MRRQNRKKILQENLLKCLYHLGEKLQDFQQPRTYDAIQARRPFPEGRLHRGLQMLDRKGWVHLTGGKAALTPAGQTEGMRIVRLHRLWELYLSTYLNLPADHVHDNAEAMEHVITPEIEKALLARMQQPQQDPHASPIPYPDTQL